MAFLVHTAAWTHSSMSSSPPPPRQCEHLMLTHTLVAWRNDSFGSHEVSVSVRGNWNCCYKCCLCLIPGKHWAENREKALVLGKWRLQNADGESILFAGTFSNPGLGHGRLKFSPVSQNNYSKIFSPRYLELCSWGSSGCSGVALGGHATTLNDSWTQCILVGWNVAPSA